MAYPSVTYTFANDTTADAAEVNTNFTDIINGFSDGTKDLNMNAGTFAGAVTFNGNVTVGNATTDDLVVTSRLASSLIPKTTATYDLGSSSLYYNNLYAKTAYLDGAVTINDSGANVDFRVEGDTDQNLLLCDASNDCVAIGIAGVTNTKLVIDAGSGSTVACLRLRGGQETGTGPLFLISNNANDTDYFAVTHSGDAVFYKGLTIAPADTTGNVYTGSFTPTMASTGWSFSSVGGYYYRIGDKVTCWGYAVASGTGSGTLTISLPISTTFSSTANIARQQAEGSVFLDGNLAYNLQGTTSGSTLTGSGLNTAATGIRFHFSYTL